MPNKKRGRGVKHSPCSSLLSKVWRPGVKILSKYSFCVPVKCSSSRTWFPWLKRKKKKSKNFQLLVELLRSSLGTPDGSELQGWAEWRYGRKGIRIPKENLPRVRRGWGSLFYPAPPPSRHADTTRLGYSTASVLSWRRIVCTAGYYSSWLTITWATIFFLPCHCLTAPSFSVIPLINCQETCPSRSSCEMPY